MKRALALLALAAGCNSTSPAPGLDGGVSKLALACTDTVEAVYTAPDNLPPYDATHRGDVVRCAYDRTIPTAQLNTAVSTLGYTGPALPSGTKVYRIAYRTDRIAGPDGKTPGGLSSALVFLPDTPRENVLVVAGHGTVGMAAQCAPSRLDLLGASGDAGMLFLGLAGAGWTVIAPDYAGFGYGSVHGWSLSEDEAHSLLDATRAMKKLLTAAPPRVALVGHSQGGHAVLSAQALAKDYGLEGQLVGVVGFAPLWLPPRTWGGALAVGLATASSGSIIAFTLHYFYGHGELYDGPGGGLRVIKDAKRDAVKDLVTTKCLGDLTTGVATLGANTSDFYDRNFIDTVGICGVGGGCADPLSMTWMKRFRADRPAIDPAGAPVVIWQGKGDATITPDRAVCGFDKIAADLKPAGKTATVCIDKDATHGSVVRRGIEWVNAWIAARALGAAEPAACKGVEELAGTKCADTPPNED